MSYNYFLTMTNKPLNIIGLAGSPRANSNSTTLLKSFIDGAASQGALCQIIKLAEMDIKPCIHCDCCCNTGRCVFNDDMVNIYGQLKNADVIAFSSPIYFMGLCSQLKLLVDRCQAFWAYRNTTGQSIIPPSDIAGRKGIFIATGARNTKSVFAGVQVTMRWVFDSLDCEFLEPILVGNCENAGDIKNMPETTRQAYDLGVTISKSYK